MSSPSSWPAPSRQQPGYQSGYPSDYPSGPLQPAPVGYGGGPLVPAQPKPERPLLPGVWWSLLYNAIATALIALAFALIGAFIWSLVAGLSEQDASWSETVGVAGGTLALVVTGIAVASLLVQWGFTVLCLVLWRLVRGFRTLHPAVQALLALLTSWIAGWILSFLLQILGVFANVFQTGTATY
ncbi:hypothetical protein GCM10028777_18260 [Angustibacter speluncae]